MRLVSDRSEPAVSVVMPTFEQSRFMGRALASVLAQTLRDWELTIVDDGSRDGTSEAVAPYLSDPRIRFVRTEENEGMGAALNRGLRLARAPLIAYLPSDDLWYEDHLASLSACLAARPDAVLAFSGVRHHYNRVAAGAVEGFRLQLVQVMHRRTDDAWMERAEGVTDDLERMFWSKLRARGTFAGSGETTCEWVDHPDQRHKAIREPEGGIQRYRERYRVRTPLRFHSSVGNAIDEVERYRRFRERPPTPPAPDGLKILLVGELAYNAERVLALEERGHRLYGLWMPRPYWYNAVGPLPFGHVADLPREGWRSAVRRLRPDIIYALLNWQAVPFAHEVLMGNPGVPFVWHFKEGPFICIEKGTWTQLVDLCVRADGRIWSSPEMGEWFECAIPGIAGRPGFILDGDLPKREWLEGARSPRLSHADGELHTVVPGRPIGLHPEDVAALARQGIHLHFYGDFTHGQWAAWIERTRSLAAGRLHLHAHVDSDRWVEEFSRYDAGWLHFFRSENRGEPSRANWDDLNYPARMATLAIAGLPLLLRDNRGSIVAAEALARKLDIGLAFERMEDLGADLRDEDRLARLAANSWRHRERFTFDWHADRLIAFFREVIEGARPPSRRRRATAAEASA